MKRAWLIFISMILIGSQHASASITTSDVTPVADQVARATQALQGLCTIAPAHPYCFGSGINLADGIEILQAQQNVQDAVAAVANAVFSFQFQTNNSSTAYPVLTAAQKRTYFDQMSYLNQLSASRNPITQKLMSLIVYRLTLDWIDIYGDPFRRANLYVDETGQKLPLRTKLQNAKNRNMNAQTVAGAAVAGTALTEAASKSIAERLMANNLAGLSSVGTMVFENPRNPVVTKLLKGVSYLMLGFDMRVPEPVMELALSSLPSAASMIAYHLGERGRKEVLNTNDVLPAPAHLITFGFDADLSVIGEDMREQWLKKERELYQAAVSSGASWGAFYFLGYLSDVSASKISVYLAEKGFAQASRVADDVLSPVGWESLEWLKAFRITPAGIVGGYLAGKLVDSTMFYWRLSDLSRSLKVAAQQHDDAKAYLIVGRIIRHYLSTTEFIQGTLNTEAALSSYSNLPRGASFDDIVGPRNNFTEQMNPLNFPNATGASLLRDAFCRLHGLLPPPSIARTMTEAQKHPISLDEEAIYRGYAYRYLSTLRSNLKTFIQNAKSIDWYFGVEIPYLQKFRLYQTANLLVRYRRKIDNLRDRARQTLAKYEKMSIAMRILSGKSPDQDLIATDIRNIEIVEWLHLKDFPNFAQDYYCPMTGN